MRKLIVDSIFDSWFRFESRFRFDSSKSSRNLDLRVANRLVKRQDDFKLNLIEIFNFENFEFLLKIFWVFCDFETSLLD